MRYSQVIAVLWAAALTCSAQVCSIVHISDTHCGGVLPLVSSNQLESFVAFITNHVSDGVLNVFEVCGTGDHWEQGTNVTWQDTVGWSSTGLQFSNAMARIAAVAQVVMCDGNHDSDAKTNNADGYSTGRLGPIGANAFGGYNGCYPGSDWNSVFPLSFFSSQSGYESCMNAGDSRNVVMLRTNALGQKFVFVTIAWATNNLPVATNTLSNAGYTRDWQQFDTDGAYSNQLVWVNGVLDAHPGYFGVVLCHYGINEMGAFAYGEKNYNINPTQQPPWIPNLYNQIGPGKALERYGVTSRSNLLFILCGHCRGSAKCYSTVRTSSGTFATAVQNSQHVNPGTTDVITFYPDHITFWQWDYVNGTNVTTPSTTYNCPVTWSVARPPSPGVQPIQAFRLQ